jgi:NAD(P)H-flavin reductase
MEIEKALSPESLTAVEMMETIDAHQRSQALEILRNFINEVHSEQKWEKLYSAHPEPMVKLAKQAIKEHREGKSKEF